ncbi:DUF2075 domain-containing protein [Vibrio chagasii]|uniref:DNA/RNA helicase domain-containing protein n=1 Tax=Vibrio chagasii TaxID=170679 RepID=UPI003DAA40D2
MKGDLYRQPSILRGTAQVFFDAKIPTFKTFASESIEHEHAALLKLYHYAKDTYQRYVVVHRHPDSGKTLLCINSVAKIASSESAMQSGPIFLSGNGPLVQVLQHTLDYSGKQSVGRTGDKVIDDPRPFYLQKAHQKFFRFTKRNFSYLMRHGVHGANQALEIQNHHLI